MLNYEEFKQEIRDNLIPRMGDKYSDCVFEEMEVNKAGKVKDGFGINSLTKKKKNKSIMPTLYFDDLYRDYLVHGDMELVLDCVTKAMLKGMKEGKHIIKAIDIEKGPERVLFQLLNVNEYQSLLNEVPHRRFLDLAVIYRWAINVSSDGFSSTIINYEMAEKYGLSEDDLYEMAFYNTRKYFPPVINSMDDIVFNMVMRNGATAKEAREVISRIPEENKMFFITNGCSKIGAVVLLYNDIFRSMARRLGSDLYVVPLSSAEIMVMPVNSDNDIEKIAESFMRLNEVQFEDEDFISDNIYYFDAELCQLSCFSSFNQGDIQ